MSTITTTGSWVGINAPPTQTTGLNSANVRWGTPQNAGGSQSGYNFEGSKVTAKTDGTEFVLGTFSHVNFPISGAGPAPFDVNLKVRVGFDDLDVVKDFSFTFRHIETPNVAGAGDDFVTLPTFVSPETVTIDGREYSVVISGFMQGGQVVTQFVSPENGTNSANIIAKLEPANHCADPNLPTDWTKITVKSSGKALNYQTGGKENGGKFIQYGPTANADNELFKIEHVGCGWYSITAKHSSKVVDITAGGDTLKNGTDARQWSYVGADNQKFRIEPCGGGFYRIMAKHSGKALTVRGGGSADNAEVEQWEWLDQDNQKWKLGSALGTPPESNEKRKASCCDSKLPTGWVKFIAKSSGKALNYQAGGKENGGAFIQYGPTANAENELFKINHLECGFYTITVKHSGKVVDVAAGGDTFKNGTATRQWDFVSAADNQKFLIEPCGGGYFRIMAKHSGKVLTVRGAVATDNAIVEQWEWVDQDNQKWKIG